MPHSGERREMRTRLKSVAKANDCDIVRDAPARCAEHLYCAQRERVLLANTAVIGALDHATLSPHRSRRVDR